MPYRFPIVPGDRVAIAPHTDLWMAGVRFGTVESIGEWQGKRFAHVRLNDHSDCTALSFDDLLGAVGPMPAGIGPSDI